MQTGIKTILRRALAGLTCIASATTLAISAIPLAQSKASSGTLGTQTSLGSPLLNTSNFSTEDWNEYETLCWGVFLSNFCQPLIDTYETAFNEGKGGSDGAGFRALWGGTGSDSANAPVIRALTDYAIKNQGTVSEPIYVSYTSLDLKAGEGNKSPKSETEITDADVRVATFQDLFFRPKDAGTEGGNTYADFENDAIFHSTEKTGYTDSQLHGQYGTIAVFEDAMVPTFYVKRETDDDTRYITILDYMDWWDVQIPSWITNALRTSELAKKFNKQFTNTWAANTNITFDSFGNIVLEGSGTMVIPGAVNQNLTGEKSINTLNSWVMNNLANTVPNESLVLQLRQNLNAGKVLKEWEGFSDFDGVINGYPAIGESDISVGLFYYDLDSSYLDLAMYGAEEEEFNYGDNLLKLLSTTLNNKKTGEILPLKFNVSGATVESSLAGATDNWLGYDKSITELDEHPSTYFTSTNYASNTLVDINFARQKREFESASEADISMQKFRKTLLSEIIRPDGSTVSLYSSKKSAVMIPVKMLSSTKSAETKKATNQGGIRLFYNWLLEKYNNSGNTRNMTKETINYMLTGSDVDSVIDEWTESTFDIFVSEYKSVDYSGTTGNDDWESWTQFFDYGNNESFCDDSGRAIIAYPASEVMRSVSAILGIDDSVEFNTYCSYIYMTYLDFYGIQSSKTLTHGVQNNSSFDQVLFGSDTRQSVLITNIAKEVYDNEENFANQIDVEEANEQLGYLMLSPEEGRDYRKSILENTFSDWMYEQYNKAVYGGASEFAGSASKAKSGFFAVPTTADNPLISFFIEWYTDIAVILILGSLLVVIVVGIIKRRKFTWFLISFVLVINCTLLVPCSGDIVPLITSNAVNKMYSDKMTFWSISQGITNATIEKDAALDERSFANLTSEESRVVLDLISDLSVVQVDGSLSVKQDISQKVTQYVADGVYANIMDYQSARWILPMIMGQFSANEEADATDFIYKPLANIWTDLSNMYWYYAPIDAELTNDKSPTLTSNQVGDLPSVFNSLSDSGGTALDDEAFGSSSDINSALDDGSDILTDEQAAAIEQNKKVEEQVSDRFAIYDNITSYFPDASKVNDRAGGDTVYFDINGKVSDDGADSGDINMDMHVNYRCYSYSLKDPARQVHLVSTYLDNIRTPISRKSVFGEHGERYKDADSWQMYIDAAKQSLGVVEVRDQNISSTSIMQGVSVGLSNTLQDAQNEAIPAYKWKTDRSTLDPKGFEFSADAYDRSDRSTMHQDIPYLWATESPIYYFYSVVKDSFRYNDNLGKLIYNLQGITSVSSNSTLINGAYGSTDGLTNKEQIDYILKGIDNNEIIRGNFMYATISDMPEGEIELDDQRSGLMLTGMVRDVLDLEELFHNTIPYLYQMSITANGFDGTSGILSNARISDESLYYEGELMSWMYRCNWATKIMENPAFSEPLTVRDSDGKSYTVNNPLLPECYPSNRPMVFSEAQKYAQGLSDRDLNVVELKCIQLNKDVARSWTLLLNYAGTPGNTREVMLRQMATDATLLFCSEFSSSGLVDTTYQLYPSSLDLRYTSFDTVMKQLMLNVSHDTSYIYGSTMLTVISNSDMITGVLLLLTTWICAYLIPFGRMILLAVVFYFGIYALIKSIFASRKTKANIAAGTLITNVLFTAYTILFFLLFKLIMGRSSADEILSTNRMTVELGSPAWVILVVLLLSAAYVFILVKHIWFCGTNRGDMGFSAYSHMASSIVGSVRSLGGKIGDGFRTTFSRETEDVSQTTTNSRLSTQIGSDAGGSTGGFNNDSTAISTASSSATSSASANGGSSETGFIGTSTTAQNNAARGRSNVEANDTFGSDIMSYMEPVEDENMQYDIDSIIEQGEEIANADSVGAYDDTSVDPEGTY